MFNTNLLSMSLLAHGEIRAAVLAAALLYIEAGLSIIPIKSDGSKAPDYFILPPVWDEVLKKS